MKDSFEKIKRSYLIRAVIAGTVGGVAAGLVCVGAVLLACKLNSVELHAGYYALIGLLPALAIGALLFLLLRPNDRRLAEKLDGKYKLRERVQTMLAYGNEEGVLPELQRQDASE
ncbi:MAG: hypothetical protein K2H43_03125, partial [Clostridia bacterium]|nr:hypothetical protein [Clostridia bacterium]